METTWYYESVAKITHPEPTDEWVEQVISDPYYIEEQPNGRLSYFGYIDEAGKWLRVVVDDGRLFNRYFDRTKLREWGRPCD